MQAGDGRVRTTAGLKGNDREEVLLVDTDIVLKM